MLKMTNDTETYSSPVLQPPSSSRSDSPESNDRQRNGTQKTGFLSYIKTFLGLHQNDTTLREAIEEYIEEPDDDEGDPISSHERALLSNILDLRNMTVVDVMVPRADIVAISVDITKEELFALLADKQFSRIPVYKGTLDDVLGTIHIKDILAALAKNEEILIPNLITDVPIVSPAMLISDLILTMRKSSRHMALVVDEYGGIDGLVTIGDIIETIVGEIDDEHDTEEEPQMKEDKDGSILADARVDIDEFEERYGNILSEEDREDSETLGGLVFTLAGRIPARGEILTHETGMVFEVLDAGPRRINQLRIRNIPRNA